MQREDGRPPGSSIATRTWCSGLTALTLTETGDSTGIFSGHLTLAGATDDAANELEAASGDTITASYDDALDGEGSDPDAVTASLTVAESEDASEREKVTLCHTPGGNPGNGHTISVGGDAPQAHLAHGDTLGPCDEESLPPTKQEQQIEAFATFVKFDPSTEDQATAPSVTVKEMRAALAVAKTSSFTVAAKELGVSQPGLSRQVQRVEKVYGFNLFDRRARSAPPTPRGALVLEAFSDALNALARSVEAA
ncbi:MAG: LysR family transcriptional regulator, partial [Chloroflexi bacterium]|nr:LysR family transcriptional regulator [Chloroflexota bacterium]